MNRRKFLISLLATTSLVAPALSQGNVAASMGGEVTSNRCDELTSNRCDELTSNRCPMPYQGKLNEAITEAQIDFECSEPEAIEIIIGHLRARPKPPTGGASGGLGTEGIKQNVHEFRRKR
jgi:hypothetical protein